MAERGLLPGVTRIGPEVAVLLRTSRKAIYAWGEPQDFANSKRPSWFLRTVTSCCRFTAKPWARPVTEKTRIGFTVAKAEPLRQFLTVSWMPRAVTDPKVFRIPAGDPNYASPPVDVTFKVDAELVWMMPHMHARGKNMTYQLTFPDGRSEVALSVPRYDFNWRIGYEPVVPIKLMKGTRLRVDAHFDNSVANRANPDPNVDVYSGTQTWEEMMNPWFGVVIDKNVNPTSVVANTPPPGV
jgi:hypothetical protein